MTNKIDLDFLRVTHLRGPNIWTYRPVIEVVIDLGSLEEAPSNKLPGLYERLTAWLPNLVIHRCGVGEHGGFLERLRDGTYAGHILEHVVLELQNLAGMKTGFGKTRQIGDGTGLYKMAFRTRQEQVGRAALSAGRDLLMAAIEDRPYDLAATVAELTDLVESVCLGPSTANIVDAATVRKIPSIRLTDGNLVQLGHGAMQRRIWTAETEETSAIAEGIASDKDLTKSLLASCGVPVPEGELVTSAEAAWVAAQDIGLPVVVKPYDGNHGRGVSLNLMTQADVEAAYALASRKGDSKSVIVERFIAGDEHRILVVGKKVVAAAKGESLWVVGNGVSNIKQLVDDQINIDPRRGTGEDSPLNALDPEYGAEILLELKRQGMDAFSVPVDGQRVLIQPNGNVSMDVTDLIHPEVAAAATLAARVVGLDIAGVDLVAEDISKPLSQQRGAIIEVNASPGLLAHIKPANGEGREVGKAIVEHLFSSEESGRIQIVGVAGTHNTSLISRLIGGLLHISNKQTGVASSQGLYLNKRLVSEGDCTTWDSGQRLLINRNVEAAVFETNARAILKDGLAYDKCLVGVVTDMGGHAALADYYIQDVDQMYKIMRTQVDVILPEGVAVLNGAEPAVVELAELCDGKVIFYALDAHLPSLVDHREKGERVVFLREQHIVLAEGANETALLPLSSLKPAKASQPETILAAVAAAWALNIDPELIEAGLRTFDSSPKQNIDG